jgi:hypothetical protein
MKGIKLVLCTFLLGASFLLQGQSILPTLKSNLNAVQSIELELENLKTAFNNSPSKAIESKMDLYVWALDFLKEPTQIPSTTEYAITSAFLNHETNWNGANDSEALFRFQRKQWAQEFTDLVNLVKL